MTQYLQDTAEAIGEDMINPGLCHFVWRACNNVVFEHMRSSDFIAFINLHKEAPIPIIKDRRVGKMCHVLYQLSLNHSIPGLANQWLEYMIDVLGIDNDTYQHHHIINFNLLGTSKSNKEFAERIQKAIKLADFINL
ncbi:MAG: hypothetical protein ACTTI4_01205 [Prevotella fusca]|uniref:hypothetical protein n=1 Tax=Prevotella fusca TaxID=589436 RepID=UPI003F9EBBCC